jgi:hypothetical protein
MSAPVSFLPSTCKAVIRRWRKGHDTWMIGRHYGIAEADVCRILAAEQDRKRRNKIAAMRRAITADFAASPF